MAIDTGKDGYPFRLLAQHKTDSYQAAGEELRWAVSVIAALNDSLLGEEPLCYADSDKCVMAEHKALLGLLFRNPGSASSFINYVERHGRYNAQQPQPFVSTDGDFPLLYKTSSGKATACIVKDGSQWLVVVEVSLDNPTTVDNILTARGWEVTID